MWFRLQTSETQSGAEEAAAPGSEYWHNGSEERYGWRRNPRRSVAEPFRVEEEVRNFWTCRLSAESTRLANCPGTRRSWQAADRNSLSTGWDYCSTANPWRKKVRGRDSARSR